MKKFGTPSGAGPGSEKENVGLDGVGTPPDPVPGAGLVVFFFFLELCFRVCGFLDLEPVALFGRFFFGAEWCEGCWTLLDGVVVFVGGGVLCEVVVVVDVVVDDVVLGVVLVVVGVEEHDSVTDWTGPVAGRWIEDSGVPGGTFTVNVSLAPPTSVTVTTHVSAEALGSAAIPGTASAVAAATATKSFRLLSTSA